MLLKLLVLLIIRDAFMINVIAEATYKIFKMEFVMNKTFDSLDQLRSDLADYVHWLNNFHIYGYLSRSV